MNDQVEPSTVSISGSGKRRGRAWVLALAVLIALAAGAPATVSAADETVPPAEKVLDKYVEATGGSAAYAKVENRVIKATLNLPGQGISLEMTIYVAKGTKSYSLIESELTGKIEKGTLGDVAWENSMMTGPRVLDGSEQALARYGATLDVMAHWRDHYQKFEVAGVEDVGERPCYKLILTTNEGIEMTVYFDRESGLMLRNDMVIETPMGDVPMESFAEDYREVGGILIPHRGVVKVMGQERVMTMNSIEQNVELPGNRFDLPEEIKTLLEKPAETK